jgi:predicted transcriptional regulator
MAVQLTLDLEQRLEHLAAHLHRSTDELAQEGLDRFLSYEESVIGVIARGRADAAAGRLLDPDQVRERIEGMFAAK